MNSFQEKLPSHPDSRPGHSQETNETARVFRSEFLRKDWNVGLCRRHNQFIEMKNDRNRKHKTESSQPSVAHRGSRGGLNDAFMVEGRRLQNSPATKKRRTNDVDENDFNAFQSQENPHEQEGPGERRRPLSRTEVFDPADESHVAQSAPLMLRKRSCQTIPLPDQDGTTHGAGEIHIRKHADSRLARKCRTFGITSWQRVKELS